MDRLILTLRLATQSPGVAPPAGTFSEVVGRIIEDMAGERAGRDVEFVVADFPTWQVDPGLLQQVFVNLISNAVKFTRDRAKARIEIGYRMNGTTLVCFVKDNGVGFIMKSMTKLVGVVQRLHSSDQFEGTGVGFRSSAHCRTSRRHGVGRRRTGPGATFYFSLPDAADILYLLRSAARPGPFVDSRSAGKVPCRPGDRHMGGSMILRTLFATLMLFVLPAPSRKSRSGPEARAREGKRQPRDFRARTTGSARVPGRWSGRWKRSKSRSIEIEIAAESPIYCEFVPDGSISPTRAPHVRCHHEAVHRSRGKVEARTSNSATPAPSATCLPQGALAVRINDGKKPASGC
jgi:hypothetical protein